MYRGFEGERGSHLYLTCNKPILQIFKDRSKDGAVIAQLGTPDMKLPIQYALYYPERRYLPGDRLDFWKLKEITFEKPDTDTFLSGFHDR